MNEVSLDFKYKFSEDYNPVYSNGAFGGANPKGEIVMNFYFERHPVPRFQTAKINNRGEVEENVKNFDTESPELTLIRYVSTGVVMNLETAKSVHQWLGQHIQQLENVRSENQ